MLKAMRRRTTKLIGRTWLFLIAAAASAVLSWSQALAMQTESKPTAPSPRQKDASAGSAPARMFVTGRVLGPQGKPVPNAAVMIHVRNYGRAVSSQSRLKLTPIGNARTDGPGRFRIDAPRTSSWRFDDDLGAVAMAPGFGVGWAKLDVDSDEPTADITLRPEQIIEGRLVDGQGRPVPDVTVSVSQILRNLPQDPDTGRARFEGVTYPQSQINDLPAWPKPALTSADGRFTLRSVGRDLSVALTTHHPRFGLQRIPVETSGDSKSRSLTIALGPAQILTGRVTYADSGQGVPHAAIEIVSVRGNGGIISDYEADGDGRFRANPPLADGSFHVTASPPQGEPYLIATTAVQRADGSLSLDVALPRGVLIRGKVTEEGSGIPVPGARVDFSSRADRQNRQLGGVSVNTASDGSFQLAARPGPGNLFINGPNADYVFKEIGNQMTSADPRPHRMYAHAHAVLDLKPGVDANEIHVALRRGVTVKGEVRGPVNEPVPNASMISPVILDRKRLVETIIFTGFQRATREGQFELHGLDPEVEVPVYFIDPARKLGAFVKLSGKSIALMTIANRGVKLSAKIAFPEKSAVRGPIMIGLEPCGAAQARIVDPEGEPVAGHLPRGIAIMMVVSPGAPANAARFNASLRFAEELRVSSVDPINHKAQLVCDAEGRLTVPALIPGATYRVIDSTAGREADPQVRKEFTVKPGETIDLGDIKIEKPAR
jgi:protocatechuate 3,4-dioxygenase beta subunit